MEKLGLVIAIVLGAFSVFSMGAIISFVVSKKLNIKKGNFVIKKDKLVDISHPSLSEDISSKHGCSYKLKFSTCLPKKSITGILMENICFITTSDYNYYKWSVNKMSGENIGKIGDEYYLIFLGKSKNSSMIYNTRYFYIEGE